MSHEPNTIFLRLEGPLQAWGDNSKFVVRRTMEAPTKSGVIGLICCAMGLSRQAAREFLPRLNELIMGVRVDRPGMGWWDYHTVGAGYGIVKAEGGIKKTASTGKLETLLTRRQYLCDASFLTAVQGDTDLIKQVRSALENPRWPLFLGRKCCPPSVPVASKPDGNLKAHVGRFNDIRAALKAQEWHPRCQGEIPWVKEQKKRLATIELDCLVEWRGPNENSIPPADVEVWFDSPVSLDPPVHEARLVERTQVVVSVGKPLQDRTPTPQRIRADYGNVAYKTIRQERLIRDEHLCVFCKSPLTRATVHHATYRHTGGGERMEDLRSLCRLCHDAVTMIEYGTGMGLDRIDPCEPRWRKAITAKRDEIVEFRSLETRRRRLKPEEVE